MAERQVTLDNRTMKLASTFMVIATQNPVESHGAYPLPEAQLDRFTMKLNIGYPSNNDEVEMLGQFVGNRFDQREIETELTLEELESLQKQVADVVVCESIRRYLVELGTATRNHTRFALGLSPRGLITWQRVSQAWALLQQRDFVVPEDVQAVAAPVLKLRVGGEEAVALDAIREVVESVEVPTEVQ